MLETSLFQAVEHFAAVTHDATGPDLERPWAWGPYDSEGVRFAFFRTYEELRELAVRTAAGRLAHGPVPTEAQRILAQYHGAYRDLQAALLGVTPEAAGQAPAEGEWPVRRVVAHMVGAEVGFFVAVRHALDRQRSADGRPAEIPDAAWGDTIGLEEAAFEAILEGPLAGIQDYHAAWHGRALEEFAGISDAEMAVPSRYWEDCEMSLRFRLHRFDSHLRQHTIQIDKTLHAIGQTPNEARRLLRLIYAALAEAEGATIGAWEAGTGLWPDTAQAIHARADQIAEILGQ